MVRDAKTGGVQAVPRGRDDLEAVVAAARACRVCARHLPLGPRPVLRARTSARLLIVGQAPGTRVHETGVPWNDPSGDRLRDWLDLDREAFYDEARIAIVPMGFCYPGRDPRGGDRPPRPECAPLWHPPLRAALPGVALTLLVGTPSPRRCAPGATICLTSCRCPIRAGATRRG
jgi:uracil-DNA glycosylase